MADILETIAAAARVRVEEKKKLISIHEMKELAQNSKTDNFLFEKALKDSGLSLICEVKKASPSKGIIAKEFAPLAIAKEYEKAGAAAVSVLTEPLWFLGKEEYLKEIAKEVKIPCLRKDFTVDEYMIYEAKVLGASAVLLIVSLLTEDTLKQYLAICDKLGISALVEVHNEEEVLMAVNANAKIIGINNRNLKDFSVDSNRTYMLRKLIPEGIAVVSESGIKTKEDIINLRRAEIDAVLIGETLMRADNKELLIKEFRRAYDQG